MIAYLILAFLAICAIGVLVAVFMDFRK